MSRDQMPGRIRIVSGGRGKLAPVPALPRPPKYRPPPPPKPSILSFENYLTFWAGCGVGGVVAGYLLTGMFFG